MHSELRTDIIGLFYHSMARPCVVDEGDSCEMLESICECI